MFSLEGATWYNHFIFTSIYIKFEKSLYGLCICVCDLVASTASFVPGCKAQLVAFQQLGQASQQRWKLRRIAGALAFGVFWFWLIHASFSCHFATLQVAAALPKKVSVKMFHGPGSFLWQIFFWADQCACATKFCWSVFHRVRAIHPPAEVGRKAGVHWFEKVCMC